MLLNCPGRIAARSHSSLFKLSHRYSLTFIHTHVHPNYDALCNIPFAPPNVHVACRVATSAAPLLYIAPMSPAQPAPSLQAPPLYK